MLKLIAAMVMVGAMGCGPGETTGSGGGPGPDCPDPAEGEVPEECGVWASVSLGSDDNPGTRAAPVASLSHAVELAIDGPRRVYACGELWTEPVSVRGGVSLIGGFSCGDGWAYKGEARRAQLTADPGTIPLTIAGVGGETLISDFAIEAIQATEPGGSSIAVFVRDNIATTIRRCDIIAGNGADGEPAAEGAPGYDGTDACGATVSTGGISPKSTCLPDEVSAGGKGGDGGLMSASAGEAGLPAPAAKDPDNAQDGDGGAGETGAVSCSAGEPGAAGAEGAFGLGAKGRGRLTNEGYVGIAGQDGKPGAPGQGGGGGGGTLGNAATCGAATPGGAGGGAGGTGGCGGKGGKGGQPGGASLGIAYRSVTLTVDKVRITTGQGGRGGKGGDGQLGGSGGQGGLGGSGMGAVKPGCPGGAGGLGGMGGPGGGGHGGPSSAFADTENYSPTVTDVEIESDYPGVGGFGGAPFQFGGSGEDGATAGELGTNLER